MPTKNPHHSNTLNGNLAKVPHNRGITPRFINYVGNEPDLRSTKNFFGGAASSLYNRLEDDAEYCKRELDDNAL